MRLLWKNEPNRFASEKFAANHSYRPSFKVGSRLESPSEKQRASQPYNKNISAPEDRVAWGPALNWDAYPSGADVRNPV